jgi:hypothetical protein
MNEVLRRVNALGLRTEKGREVSPQSFNKILRNRVYAGVVVVSKWKDLGPVVGKFEPLIDGELFDRVQIIISGGVALAKTHHWSHKDFPLRRFIRCGICDKPFTGSWSRGRNKEKKYPYYSCRSCKGTGIRKENIEAKFVDFLKCLTPKRALLDLFEAVVLDALQEKQKERTGQIAILKREMARIEATRGKFEKAFVIDEKIKQQTYDRQMQELEADLLSKKIALRELEVDEMDTQATVAYARSLLENAWNLWRKASSEQKEKLQAVLFPQGITYSNGKFGTTVTGSSFSLIQLPAASESRRVTPTGFEPVLPP